MFGTLHYNANSNETQFVQRSVGGSGDGGYALAYFACENCRTKKVVPPILDRPYSLTRTCSRFSSNATDRRTAVSGARLPRLRARMRGIVPGRRPAEGPIPTNEQGMER
ncbi:hypothetical protein XPA_006238 [Xanthoria parietina]